MPVFLLSVAVSVRTAAGTSTKSLLFHKWTRDTRDNPILGTRRVRAQLLHELAGLGGGASFYKAEGSLHASRVLHPGLVSQPLLYPRLLNIAKTDTSVCTAPLIGRCRARAGILHSLSNADDGTAPTLSDRFQLGGPTNLRMFRAISLGPRDGGALLFSSTLRIRYDNMAKLPLLPSSQSTRWAATCSGLRA